jgi:hypothetical protein
MNAFRLVGLAPEPFAPFFALSDEQLAERGIHRVVADRKPGFPCRISLVDAEIGEPLLLLPYCHQPANSPYQASGPIFIRSGARQRIADASEVPPYVTERLMSVRAYDERDFHRRSRGLRGYRRCARRSGGCSRTRKCATSTCTTPSEAASPAGWSGRSAFEESLNLQ